MKLRDHPKVKGEWPPEWHPSNPRAPRYHKTPIGEQGVLKEVRKYSHPTSGSGHLALLITCEEEEYCGQIDLNDRDLLQALFNKLKECVEMPLQKIGDLDF